MNDIKLDPWKCHQCGHELGILKTDRQRQYIVLDEERVKVECFIEEGSFKRWCPKCNALNILRPLHYTKLGVFK